MRIVGIGYHGSERPKGVFYVSIDRRGCWSSPYSFGDLTDCPEPGGYARVLQRADGRMVACYYWATEEAPHQHIAATIRERES